MNIPPNPYSNLIGMSTKPSPQPSSSPTSNLSSSLKYFLTLLRGELVVCELSDGRAFEGLFHTLEDQTIVLRMAQQQAEATTEGRNMPRRETERNTQKKFEGVLKLPISSIVQVFASDLSLAQWTVAYAEWMASHAPKQASHGARTGGAGTAFATDSQISGASDKERELVRWDGASDDSGLEGFGSTSVGDFNQFETFERMTGKTSTFKFDDYSTPLDKGSAFYKSNEARAQQIASQILASDAGSAHVRLEREGDELLNQRDRDADEGDLFSDVRREQPNSTGKYKPGAFGQAKKAAAANVGGPQATGKTTPVTSPTKDGANKAGGKANGTASASPEAATTTSPQPAAGASSKPLEISLAAQQKAAEIAASPKEPTPAPEANAAAAPASTAVTTESKDAAAAGASSTDQAGGSAPASEGDKAAAVPKTKLNPKAKPFKLSAAAAEFTPGAPAASVPLAVAPVPILPPQQAQQFLPTQPLPNNLLFMPPPVVPGVPSFPQQMNSAAQLQQQMMNLGVRPNLVPPQPYFVQQQNQMLNQQAAALLAAQLQQLGPLAGGFMPGTPQFNQAVAAAQMRQAGMPMQQPFVQNQLLQNQLVAAQAQAQALLSQQQQQQPRGNVFPPNQQPFGGQYR